MAFDVGAVVAHLQIDTSGAKAQISQFLTTFDQKITTAQKKTRDFLLQNRELVSRLGTMVTAQGAAIVGAFAMATRAAASFEAQMRNVNSIMRQTEEQFKITSDKVLALSTKFPQSADTLARGLYDVVSSGFQGAEAMTVLEASAKAATAGLSTTATAARAISGVINAYGMTASDANHISDILFKTVDRGVITFEELAQNLGESIAATSTAGVSMEELGAAVATMTKAGIPASETMTSLSRIVTTFIDPPKELAAALKQVTGQEALQIIQTQGLVGAVEALNKVAGDNPALLGTIGLEMRALRGAMSLTREEGTIFRQELDLMNKASGSTAKAFAEQSKSFALQWTLMRNQLTAAAITVGQELLPALRPLIETIRKIANSVAAWAKEHPALVRYLALVTGGVGALMLALGPLMFTLPTLIQLFTVTGITMAGLVAVGGPIALLIIALGVLTAAYMNLGDAAQAALKEINGFQKGALRASLAQSKALSQYMDMAQSAREAATKLRAAGDPVAAQAAEKQALAYERMARAAAITALETEKTSRVVKHSTGGAGTIGGLVASGAKKSSQEEKRTALDISRLHEERLRLDIELAKTAEEREQAERRYHEWAMIAYEKWRNAYFTKLDPAYGQWAERLKDIATQANKIVPSAMENLSDAWAKALSEAEPEKKVFFLRSALASAPPGMLREAIQSQLDEAIKQLHESVREKSKEIEKAGANFWDSFITGINDSAVAKVFRLRAELATLPEGLLKDIVADALKRAEAELRGSVETHKKVASEIDQIWTHAMERIQDGFSDTIAHLIETGATLKDWWTGIGDMFRRVWAELIASLITMWVRNFINRVAVKWLGEALFPVPAMAAGGIVTRPTLVMAGEAGPEAIVPLSRSSSSGVDSLSGSAAPTYNITIQAIDTQSGIEFLMQHRKTLGAALAQTFDEGSPAGRRRRG